MENKNHFYYSERNLGEESDNQISYEVGPMSISISGWSEEIIISTSKQWSYLLPEVLETARLAWELKDEDIKIEEKECRIIIKLNYKILLLYIEHNIIF